MRVGLCQLVLSAVLLTIVPARESVGESTPWFDGFLVTFPDALLLKRESPHPPASSASVPVSHVSTSVSNASKDVPQDSPVVSQGSPVGATPVASQEEGSSGTTSELEIQPPSPPMTSPVSCSCASQRRCIFAEGGPCSACEYWQILPDGILFPSFVAGEKEPRMSAAVLSEKDRGTIFEDTIGGRLGLLRYGTPGPINPQGWQWDLESAAMLRQDLEEELDVDAVDFRIGSVLTWRRGPTQLKGGFYHLSSHVGDEFLERNPDFQRLNYSRDALLVAVRHYVTSELDFYGELAYSVRNDGGSEPVELQFGAEYTSLGATDPCGAPFAAVNAHLREEFDFGGSLNVLAGWEWRGPTSNRRLRIGGQYYNGKEIQWSFFEEDVQLTGVGIWYDF